MIRLLMNLGLHFLLRAFWQATSVGNFLEHLLLQFQLSPESGYVAYQSEANGEQHESQNFYLPHTSDYLDEARGQNHTFSF